MFLMPVAMLCFFYTVLLLEQSTMEQFVPVIFWISTTCFFILLYNPGILFVVTILLLSYALFVSYVYHYEKKIEKLNE
jgi:Ca2+/Na+ antiporter